jgi:RNA polymerase sigma-70 factor, ECF subfamily
LSHSINAELALAIHRRQERAIDRLVRAYEERLFSYALHLTRNPFDAQEVTQDAFLKAFRTLTERYDEQQCRDLMLEPWLFRIARNLAFNRLRSQRSRAKLIASNSQDAGDAPVSPQSPTPDLEARENRELLMKALKCLSPGERELILLRFMEEMSYARIARVLGTTEAALRGRIFRAVRKLNAAYGKLENGRGL